MPSVTSASSPVTSNGPPVPDGVPADQAVQWPLAAEPYEAGVTDDPELEKVYVLPPGRTARLMRILPYALFAYVVAAIALVGWAIVTATGHPVRFVVAVITFVLTVFLIILGTAALLGRAQREAVELPTPPADTAGEDGAETRV